MPARLPALTGGATLDATSSGNGSGSSITISHTVGAGLTNSLLVCCVSTQDSNHSNLPIVSVTFGGAAFTKAVADPQGSGNVHSEIWYLLNPTAQTANIIVTATGLVTILAVNSSWQRVNQTGQIDSSKSTNGTASALSLVNTVVGSNALVIDCVSAEASVSSTGQTSIGSSQKQSFENVAASYKVVTAGGALTLTETLSSSQAYSICSVAFGSTPKTSARTAASNRQEVRDFGTSLKFAGVSDVVTWTNITPAVPTTTTPVTLSAWFKMGASPLNNAATQPVITYKYYYIHLRLSGSMVQPNLRYDNAGAKIASGNAFPAADRNWHHVVGIINPTGGNNITESIYVDGLLINSTNQTVLASTDNNPTGGYAGKLGAGFFNGYIDKVRVFHRAFTAAEVLALYLRDTNPETPVVAYEFNEGSGTTANDSSGNGNNGVITGATYSSDVVMKARTSV